jgi:phosphatidylserine/phosphatidylglycerophosphate/cardiolipin synthase-like enzyme
MTSLEEAVVHAARRLSHAQIAALAEAFQRHPGPSSSARLMVLREMALPRVQEVARIVVDAWPEGLPGAAVALALRAASQAVEELNAEQSLDIVWTGPASAEVPVRRTLAVLLEVIRAARQRLTMVSFAAYKVEDVAVELRAAAARGVDIRLILETERDSRSALSVDAAAAFTTLRNVATFWVWPAELRPGAEHRRIAQHAKASLADDRLAFITSANLTGQALHDNMELGVLITGGPVPRRLDTHFRQLMDDGILRKVGN